MVYSKAKLKRSGDRVLPSTLMSTIIIPFINEMYMYNFVIPSVVKEG
jgi:hypothetical protein